MFNLHNRIKNRVYERELQIIMNEQLDMRPEEAKKQKKRKENRAEHKRSKE